MPTSQKLTDNDPSLQTSSGNPLLPSSGTVPAQGDFYYDPTSQFVAEQGIQTMTDNYCPRLWMRAIQIDGGVAGQTGTIRIRLTDIVQ